MSELLFSSSQVYLSEMQQVESFIEDELILPNVALLTKFMVGAVTGILLTILVKLYLNGNDNFWPDRGIGLVRASEVSSIFDKLRGRKGVKDMDIAMYRKVGENKCVGTMEAQRPVLFVKDLDLTRDILVKDFDYFVNRRQLTVEETEPLIMRMLSNLTDEEWREMRTILTPTLTTSKIREMFSYFNSCGVQLAEFVRTESEKGGNLTDGISVTDSFGRFTMDVIATACFGVESSCLKEKHSSFYKHGKMFQSSTPWRMAKVFIAFFFPRIAALLRISFIEQESTNFFKNIVEHTINHMENNEKGYSQSLRQDFLQLLLHTRDNKMKIDEAELDSFEIEARLDDSTASQKTDITPSSYNSTTNRNGISCAESTKTKMYLTDELILAQSILFFRAGVDSTTSLLTFAIYSLAVHPECQERLYHEVEKCFQETNRNLEHESLNSLQYMDMFLNETLRMYPPATRLERRCTKEYQVPHINLTLPKETLVVIPVIAFHYDGKYFPDPDKFIPERFSPENKSKIHPYSFIPFGHGPRNCIGMRFAVAEAKAAIAHLVHNFIIEPTSSTPIPMQYDNFSPLLKPVRMMKIRFRPRK